MLRVPCSLTKTPESLRGEHPFAIMARRSALSRHHRQPIITTVLQLIARGLLNVERWTTTVTEKVVMRVELSADDHGLLRESAASAHRIAAVLDEAYAGAKLFTRHEEAILAEVRASLALVVLEGNERESIPEAEIDGGAA